MTDQTIPAEKVRELIEKFKEDTKHDCIVADLRALLPAQQPTSGLFGKWAKHQEHGDVMCIWGKPDSSGHISVHWAKKGGFNDVEGRLVLLSELTFPHQATKPADVPEDQPWLVDVEATHVFESGMVGIRCEDGLWSVLYANGDHDLCSDKEITLVCPLVPERPVSDLQAKSTERALDRVKAKYDELESKYREAQERIKTLEQPQHPRTVTTPEEYDALPVGSHVRAYPNSCIWKRCADGMWRTSEGATGDSLHDFHPRAVLRYGWGDEQPAWRIEHDHTNLRVGEYIIDADGDTGTINRAVRGNAVWCVGMASTSRECGPWIAFVNKEAATPEAIAEAKRARDKEMEE